MVHLSWSRPQLPHIVELLLQGHPRNEPPICRRIHVNKHLAERPCIRHGSTTSLRPGVTAGCDPEGLYTLKLCDIHIDAHFSIHTHMYIYTHMCTYGTCIYNMYTCIHILCISTYVHTYNYICVYMHIICIYVCMYYRLSP